MTGIAFLKRLSFQLDFLNEDDRKTVVSFYERKLANATTLVEEEAIVKSFGSPEHIAKKLKEAYLSHLAASESTQKEDKEAENQLTNNAEDHTDIPLSDNENTNENSDLSSEDDANDKLIFSKPAAPMKAAEMIHSLENKEVKSLYGEKVVIEDRSDPIEEISIEPIDAENGLTEEEIRLAKEETLEKANSFTTAAIELPPELLNEEPTNNNNDDSLSELRSTIAIETESSCKEEEVNIGNNDAEISEEASHISEESEKPVLTGEKDEDLSIVDENETISKDDLEATDTEDSEDANFADVAEDTEFAENNEVSENGDATEIAEDTENSKNDDIAETAESAETDEYTEDSDVAELVDDSEDADESSVAEVIPSTIKRDGIITRLFPPTMSNGLRIFLSILLSILVSPILLVVFGVGILSYAIAAIIILAIGILAFALIAILIILGVVELIYGFAALFDTISVALIEIGIGTVLFGVVTAIAALIYEFLFGVIPKTMKGLTKYFVKYLKNVSSFLYGGNV